MLDRAGFCSEPAFGWRTYNQQKYFTKLHDRQVGWDFLLLVFFISSSNGDDFFLFLFSLYNSLKTDSDFLLTFLLFRNIHETLAKLICR